MRNKEVISRRTFLTGLTAAVGAVLVGCEAPPQNPSSKSPQNNQPENTPFQENRRESPLPVDRGACVQNGQLINLNPSEFCGNRQDGWTVRAQDGRQVQLPGHINPADYIHERR